MALFQGGTNQENTAPSEKIEYPANHMEVSTCGHVFQRNNTPDGERIRLLHGTTGNFIDFDEKRDTYLISYNNTNVETDHNMTVKIGKNLKEDKLVIQVVGDVHMYVEGDMHTEVDGDRFDTVGGKWEMKSGDVMFLNSDTSTVVKAENKLTLKSAEYTNQTTFLKNDLEEGGDVENVVNGNYVTRIKKETSTFAVESDGDIRTNAKGTRYERVEGNMFTQVDGKYRIQADGGEKESIAGGEPTGQTVSLPGDSAYGNPTGVEIVTPNTRITTTDFEMYASGAAKMTAGGTEFKIECNNGIYLN